jgi:hypothetical protein
MGGLRGWDEGDRGLHVVYTWLKGSKQRELLESIEQCALTHFFFLISCFVGLQCNRSSLRRWYGSGYAWTLASAQL